MRWELIEGPAAIAEKLWRTNGRLQSILSFLGTSPMPALVMDQKSRVLHMNQAAEQLFRRRASEIRGQTIPEIVANQDPRYAARLLAEDRRVLHGDSPVVSVDLIAGCTSLKFAFRDEEGEPLLGWIGARCSRFKDKT